MEFYDQTGAATCYSSDNVHFYLWGGEPIGYLYDDRVYSFGGKQLGWFDGGWLYDRTNRPALFLSNAVGGPVKPVKQVKSVKGVKHVKPVKAVKQVAIVRPVKSLSWSGVTNANYFQQ